MPILSVRIAEESYEALKAKARTAGFEDLSAYARMRLGLKAPTRKASPNPEIRLSLTRSEELAISRATGEGGFGNRSAYVRARLFLTPAPPPAFGGRREGTQRIVTFTLEPGDDKRLERMRGNTKRRTYVMARLFGRPLAKAA